MEKIKSNRQKPLNNCTAYNCPFYGHALQCKCRESPLKCETYYEYKNRLATYGGNNFSNLDTHSKKSFSSAAGIEKPKRERDVVITILCMDCKRAKRPASARLNKKKNDKELKEKCKTKN